jgi:hypothetical protein
VIEAYLPAVLLSQSRQFHINPMTVRGAIVQHYPIYVVDK